MFGDKFYPTLGKLSPWKQSLFALCLTQRQFGNYVLWARLNQKDHGIGLFNQALTALWHFHQDKFNHIDLTAEFNACLSSFPLQPDKQLPAAADAADEPAEDISIGDLCALNAAHSLRAAFEAVTLHEGDEAEKASKSSLSSVLLTLNPEEDPAFDALSDEEVRELPPVDEEVNFQVSLLELLLKGTRGPELTQLLLKISLKDGCSNIGLTLEEDELQLCSFRRYALKPQSRPHAANKNKAPRKTPAERQEGNHKSRAAAKQGKQGRRQSGKPVARRSTPSPWGRGH